METPTTAAARSVVKPGSATAANVALSEPSTRKPRKKRAKVSFSQEVISKDNSGNGSKVVIKEEHGVFLGPLLGRMVVSSAADRDGGATSDAKSRPVPPTPMISFANDEHVRADSRSPHGILRPPSGVLRPLGNTNVEYDNLLVRMGLLKCGLRYRVVVPVPHYWKQKDALTSSHNDSNKVNPTEAHLHESHDMNVQIVEDSLDGDLRGEIQTEYAHGDGSSSSALVIRQHHVCITLSAHRRGPYRGRFVLELTRHQNRQEPRSLSSLNPMEAPLDNPPSEKCFMSLQIDATIMGKDMGTPKLRNDVLCLGKIVGYDSDDETEWQGFD